ncbi:UNVERIFIED_CONTAM: hypothetical protein K2H54_008639 [Gekko kuhli]
MAAVGRRLGSSEGRKEGADLMWKGSLNPCQRNPVIHRTGVWGHLQGPILLAPATRISCALLAISPGTIQPLQSPMEVNRKELNLYLIYSQKCQAIR